MRKKPKNWPAFLEGMAQDKAIHSIVRLCNILFASGIQIILCSGRSEEHREETVKWLAQQGVNYHELLLRGDKDRSGVVEMWRSEGLVCLQCAPGEF